MSKRSICLSVLHPLAAAACRALIEKGWDCHGRLLRTLIAKIGDYEEGVIDIILCAIENAT